MILDAMPSRGAKSRGRNPPVCKILRFFASGVFSRAKSRSVFPWRRQAFSWLGDRATFLFKMFLAISQQQSTAPRLQVLKNFLRSAPERRPRRLSVLRCAFSSADIVQMMRSVRMSCYLFGLVDNLLIADKYVCPDPVLLARFGSQIQQQVAVRRWCCVFECLD